MTALAGAEHLPWGKTYRSTGDEFIDDVRVPLQAGDLFPPRTLMEHGRQMRQREEWTAPAWLAANDTAARGHVVFSGGLAVRVTAAVAGEIG